MDHIAFVILHLADYRDNLPHGSSNGFITHSVARKLDNGSIQAIAAWLALASRATRAPKRTIHRQHLLLPAKVTS